MSDYITDPDLLEKLNAPAEKPADKATESGYVTDPSLLAQLNGEEAKGPDVNAVPVVPMGTGPMITPQELQAARNVAQPIVDVGKATLNAYKTAPWKIAADLATTSATGVPVFGAAGAAENIMDKVNAAGEVSKFASQTVPGVDAAGQKVWAGVDAYRDMWSSLSVEDKAKLSNAYHNQGGPNGVKSFINSPEGRALIESNPKFAAAATKYLGEVPGALTQAGRLAAPIARTALKAIGPAAIGYDLYQAGQLARETQLGQRLAQGEGQFAPNAASDVMLNRNVSGYQPTPQEAANLLASGDARTIQMYGGAQRLAQQAQQRQAQPAMPSWIDTAMQNFQRYRGVIGQ
jgi:hypothetical protein